MLIQVQRLQECDFGSKWVPGTLDVTKVTEAVSFDLNIIEMPFGMSFNDRRKSFTKVYFDQVKEPVVVNMTFEEWTAAVHSVKPSEVTKTVLELAKLQKKIDELKRQQSASERARQAWNMFERDISELTNNAEAARDFAKRNTPSMFRLVTDSLAFTAALSLVIGLLVGAAAAAVSSD